MSAVPIQKRNQKSQNAIVSAVNIDKQEFLDVLQDCLGLVNLAFEKTGIDRKTYYNWLDDDHEFSKKVHEASEYAGDKVEGMLFKKIKDGDTQAIMFYCETKLRSRGYFKKS